jgi:acetylglutamate kinase
VKLVIKIGGSLLDEEASRVAIARQLATVAGRHRLVVVHGGGKQLTRFLEDQGVTSRFVDGLRVSDAPVIDAALKIIAGSVNKRLVAALVALGVPAVGLSGVDGPLTIADQMDADLAFVGRPAATDGRLLDTLLSAGYTPVVACIAGDRQGNIYNVNADQMAVSCAAGWQADRLFFLTDVAGVRDAGGRLLSQLSVEEADALIAAGIAHSGMQAKLQATEAGLRSGVGEIVIAPGNEPDVCARLLRGEAVGTRLQLAAVPDRSVSA